MLKMILPLLLVITSLGCYRNDDRGGNSDVHIRISNISQYEFSDIMVSSTTGMMSYGDLQAGQFSDYKVYQTAYRYAYIELTINDATYIIQPIDFVGEDPLDPGYYTYAIDASSSQSTFGRLSLSLIRD